MDIGDEIERTILEKLMEYGDSVLEDPKPGHHTTQNGRKACHHRTNEKGESVSKKKVKKKKKKKQAVSVDATDIKCHKGKQNSLRSFDEELRLFKAAQEEKDLEVEENIELDRRKDCDEQKKKRKPPEVVVFNDPTKRKKENMSKVQASAGPKGREQSEGEVDLDQARHEVWKFGISGLSFEDKEKHEAAKAVQLGAKPPKRAFVNYKELMETKRQKKIEEKQQREIDRQMGLKTSKKKDEKIQLQNIGFWTDKTQRKGVYVDGQLGKYKRGVQVFSKRDIAKIKNQTGKRKGKR
ncbi:uncharacterized protein C1orf131-like [Lytechinus variegatus]|uniref:uncharacterized protein C1orf131-like n=1 Tax=Lytechinus variegatus TaxID=7654 RepID=UPI001BB16145|nr:uncharacterized protein C1orf131-like [Lytechinus variegatus]